MHPQLKHFSPGTSLPLYDLRNVTGCTRIVNRKIYLVDILLFGC